MPAARMVVKDWIVKSVIISLFGTATDLEEVDDACARESGRSSRKGKYVVRVSIAKEEIRVAGLMP